MSGKENRIFTERAHLMCPHMCFGIVMSIDSAFETGRLQKTFGQVAGNHPFLRAVLGYDEADNGYYYDVTDSSKIDLQMSEDELNGIDDPKLIAEYDRLTGYDWDIRSEGLLKAVAWKMQDKTAILLVFHHLIADGRGALELATEIADAYKDGTVREPVSEKLISSADEFPAGSELPFMSRMLVDKANRDWKKEGNKPLSYQEYHEYADGFVKNDKVKISVKRTSSEELSKTISDCKAHSVTLNDLLMAKMYKEDKTGKIIIAKDLRGELPCYQKGALGNYSTAFSIEVKKTDRDLWELAQEVHKKVQKTLSDPRSLYLVLQCYARLEPAVLDAAFMATKGGFNSKSASFIGKMFFAMDEPKGYSITNLGKIESNSIISAYFIPPASPAIKKTAGILTVNGEMITCVSER